jgi:hypothetical protein
LPPGADRTALARLSRILLAVHSRRRNEAYSLLPACPFFRSWELTASAAIL